jgi:hypothetical protein
MKFRERDRFEITAVTLNERGILPFSARQWNWENVRAIAVYNQKKASNGFIKRPDVMEVLKEVTINLLEDARQKEAVN